MKPTSIIFILGVLMVGCGGSTGQTRTASTSQEDRDMGKIGHLSLCEAQPGGRESEVDLNQDKRPDVRKIFVPGDNGSERLFCREADLNYDGVKDIFVFFDEEGLKKRDEVDLDHDGVIDIVTIYVAGKPIKQEIDTNSDGIIDRVRYLDGGVPVRLEGDTDEDGKVDYWEYYEGGQLIRVGMDTNGDGRADTWNRDEDEEVEADEAEAPAAEPGKTEAGEAPDVEEDPYAKEPKAEKAEDNPY